MCMLAVHAEYIKNARLYVRQIYEIFLIIYSDWFCSDCLKGLFPYNHLESDFDFYRAIDVDFTLLRNANSLRFVPFSVSEEKPLLNNGDLDPEENLFNDFNLPESQYMTAVDFCTSSKQNSMMSTTFSMLHINCRSLNKNFEQVLLLIGQLSISIPVIGY